MPDGCTRIESYKQKDRQTDKEATVVPDNKVRAV